MIRTKIIIEFETEKQTERFFGLFDDRSYGCDEDAVERKRKSKTNY